MIRFFLIGLAQACFRTNLDNLPNLETCSHELNFERKTLPKVNVTKIVGGINAKNNQWPFITRLTVETDAGQALCGGTIIDNNWILTAAHCCDGANSIDATFGDLSQNSVDSREFTLRSSKIIKHPRYRASNLRYDVCLVKLSGDIIASDPDESVKIACLTDHLPQQGSDCWIAGWGNTQSSGTVSNKLKQAHVTVMEKDYCIENSNYGASDLKSEMICAGKLDNNDDGLTDGGVDSCQGDSGGPLICAINGRASLVGVVSWGNGCASEGFPGVYSSAAFKGTYNWIRRTVRPTATNSAYRFLDWLNQLF
ncbi:Oidioi.mRNA.OKI2018_I69.chr2.g4987.t1.cds [Oikopleura dioica]|uniref:Oidioi.mRNA.OKI2018_I69.chr2.g4987.t1.cds n=1 Tax=Oikopleura dioica TaxID=34765 RepID=A0ABN7T0M8_OIKDI|nr:Oidioi.mRNA.OKI2018_I69.chr2.g4987.t1.cds [Oikopleura dioica]